MSDKEHIVVAVGFHKKAEGYQQQAINICKQLKAKVTIVHAIEYIPYYPYFPYDEEKVEEDLHAEINEKYEALKKTFVESGVEVAGFELVKDKAYKAICDTADKIKATKIIIGVGPHYLLENMIGSTADKVIRIAHQAVILINQYKNLSGLDKIVCGYDFTESSDQALVSASKMAKKFRDELHVVHVIPDGIRSLDEESDEYQQIKIDVETKIKSKIESLNVICSKVSIYILHGNPVTELSNFIEENGLELLVIGTYSHNAFTRLLLGSTTEKIVRKAPCNIMTTNKGIVE